ncbi:SGNH/GDSL hydrolase family protein [Oricola cellulosilytica]|uniref:SGNH/GDSL hydrolase family protein n=1 Tax=Oricola cellulosilytica TaxID=1429082 RepID=UPI0026CFFC15
MLLRKALFSWIAFPFYVWQGIALRLKIERLHPPDIAPEGDFEGEGEEIRLLVAGDSSVAGVGMASLEETLTYNLATIVNERTGRPLYWRAAGANSATAGDLRDHVIPNLDRRDYTDVVLVVGTNDMKNFHAVRRFKKEFGSLVYAVRTRFPHARIYWAPVADMTLIPALPKTLGKILKARADLINEMGARLCRERGLTIVEPVPILGPEGFARDGFHAGPAGYRSWAGHLADYLYPQRAGSGLTRSSQLEGADDEDNDQPGQRELPEIAALAHAGQADRLDDLDHHRKYDENR